MPVTDVASSTPRSTPRPAMSPPARTSTRFRYGLAVIAAVALVVRIGRVIQTWSHFRLGADPNFYHVAAQLLADGHGFASPAEWTLRHRILPSAGHVPLYIGFLAGLDLLGFTSHNAHRIASCFLGAGTVVLIGLVARRLGGNRLGLIAAGIAAIYPGLWAYDALHLSETPAALGFAAVLLLGYRYLERPTIGRALALGAGIGLETMVRQEATMLLLLLCIPAILSRRYELPAADRVKRLVAIGAMFALVVSPWVVRNMTTFRRPVVLSTGAGVVLAYGSCHDTYYGDLLGWWSAGCVKEQQGKVWDDESDIEHAYRGPAVTYVRGHLARTPVVFAARAGRLWAVYRVEQGISLNGRFEYQSVAVGRAIYYSSWALGLLAIAGAIILRRRRVLVWPLLAFVAAATLAGMTSFGILRYRIAGEVVIPILAAVVLDWLWGRLRPAAPTPAPGGVPEPAVAQPAPQPELT